MSVTKNTIYRINFLITTNTNTNTNTNTCPSIQITSQLSFVCCLIQIRHSSRHNTFIQTHTSTSTHHNCEEREMKKISGRRSEVIEVSIVLQCPQILSVCFLIRVYKHTTNIYMCIYIYKCTFIYTCG